MLVAAALCVLASPRCPEFRHALFQMRHEVTMRRIAENHRKWDEVLRLVEARKAREAAEKELAERRRTH